ncbi:MAG TPA: HAD-IA family hydrolase [Pirellulales bacterium]|jgi:putative hydrolase of the HAD superfamily|nr:HAD-IA family hydrolase [Pirellulales bacterium]
MTVQAVLFDAVGTLIYADPPAAAAYASAARRFGANLSEDEILARFRRAFDGQNSADRMLHGQRTGPERERQRWREIVDEVFRDAVPRAADRETVFVELWRHFSMPKSWRVYDDVERCWESLAERGLFVTIASNFDDRLEEIARRTAPLHQAARLFVSARIGFRKPACEFFQFIERELDVEPAALLSVGDDPENDYLGAKAAGWQAILLDRAGGGRHSRGTPDVIPSLADLADRI